ncbi:hypothetical protein HPB48_003845 [Haemaphysalis longicornis]|uniref:Uncharacterized protein n=1 Tax=Haemaphysalis longicornis TaxID=44386 RepID=A0A9J6FAC8_HAELO|nr:hypothetical protein HPB48_003845 [Haemaphysalis longicornis]
MLFILLNFCLGKPRCSGSRKLPVPERPLAFAAEAPCQPKPAQLEPAFGGGGKAFSLFLLADDKQSVRAALVPTVKASNSHSAGVRVVYTVNDPVAKVVFTDGSDKTFLTTPADNSTSSFTTLSSLTPGRASSRLSKCLQSSKGNLTEAMKLVRAVMSSLEEIRVEDVRMEAQKLVEEIQENQLRMDDDETSSDADLLKIGSSYKTKILENMRARFCDQFQELELFHCIFHAKQENPDFRRVSQLCGTSEQDMVTEYSIYRRYPGELASQQALLRLAREVERKTMFPALASAATRILLLPVGTVAVELSFFNHEQNPNIRQMSHDTGPC